MTHQVKTFQEFVNEKENDASIFDTQILEELSDSEQDKVDRIKETYKKHLEALKDDQENLKKAQEGKDADKVELYKLLNQSHQLEMKIAKKQMEIAKKEAKSKKNESFEEIDEAILNEKDVKSDDDFKEYAETVLKKAFGDDYDEAKAKKTIEGLLKSKKGGDYGEIIGKLQSSLG